MMKLLDQQKEQLDRKRNLSALLIQKHFRRFRQRKRFSSQKKKIIRLQSIVRTYTVKKQVKLYKKKSSVMLEIVETERSYVNSLKVVMESFVMALRQQQLMDELELNRQHVKAIFSEIEVLFNFQRFLLEQLEKKQPLNFYTNYGEVFVKMPDVLKVYTVYVNNFDQSLSTLKELSKNKAFVDWLRKRENDQKVHLDNLLITPIQRIPRYVLLLQDLLKYTRKHNADFEQLKTALKLIKETADIINSRKRVADQSNEVFRIHKQVKKKKMVCCLCMFMCLYVYVCFI